MRFGLVALQLLPCILSFHTRPLFAHLSRWNSFPQYMSLNDSPLELCEENVDIVLDEVSPLSSFFLPGA